MRIVTADIGGTNARFAIAEVADGRVVSLGEPVVLRAADHAGLASAWAAFGDAIGEPLPHLAAIGVAGPVNADKDRQAPVRFVNSPWVVDPATLADELSLVSFLLLNDFGAMAHAVHALGDEWFAPVCGPDAPLPARGAISVIGPGTGLGVAVLQRLASGPVVLETEGSHIHFAPLDAAERAVCDAIAAQHGRASVERVASGPGLGEIVRTVDPGDTRDDAALWDAALAGADDAAARALDLLLAAFGSAAGDLSLAHGAYGVALTGGLANRLRERLAVSDFAARFVAKGRYRARMESVPVRLLTHPQPGLYGAAAAFALEHMP